MLSILPQHQEILFTLGVTEHWYRLPRGSEVSILGEIWKLCGHSSGQPVLANLT